MVLVVVVVVVVVEEVEVAVANLFLVDAVVCLSIVDPRRSSVEFASSTAEVASSGSSRSRNIPYVQQTTI